MHLKFWIFCTQFLNGIIKLLINRILRLKKITDCALTYLNLYFSIKRNLSTKYKTHKSIAM